MLSSTNMNIFREILPIDLCLDCNDILIIFSSYIPIWNIIDTRWEIQLYGPLHITTYFLNPHYHYNLNFKVNANIKIILYQCLKRIVPDAIELCKFDLQLESFKNVKELFSIEIA